MEFEKSRDKVDRCCSLIVLGFPSEKQVNSLGILNRFSYESLRLWYHKIANLFANTRRDRRYVAIDETKIKIGDEYIGIFGQL